MTFLGYMGKVPVFQPQLHVTQGKSLACIWVSVSIFGHYFALGHV